MDPRNPDRLFAGLWDFRRKGWTFRSGSDGPTGTSGSGLFLTEDGGATWKKLDAKSAPGLPEGPWGRLDVAIAPSKPDRVYAVIESVKSALFRSDDGGKTWARKDDSQRMVWRPFYFSRLVVDPTNPDRVYKPNLTLIASEDGGESFGDVGGGTHGDHHDVWINPKNPKHVVTGDDGGLWISHDGANRWWKCNNLPVSQFYHVSVDEKEPYQVYGGLQDNSSWAGDSAYPGGITNSRWENLYNGDGFWVFVDPADPNFVYAEMQGGFIGRIDRRTLAARDIQPKAGYKEKLRWNWNTPIHVSRLEKGKLYIGAQFLFVTKDGGQSWQRISPDLTTNDPEKQKQEQSGGITVDNSAAEMHTTIYSISESPRDAKTIWVGHRRRQPPAHEATAGATWTNLVKNVPGLPPASWVSWVEAGPHADGAAYAAFDRHTFGDMTPWVYATKDFGKTWERIVGPSSGVRGWAYVIKEDPVRPGPPLPRDGVRPLDLARRGEDLGRVQGRQLPVRLRARPRVPDARPGPRRRDARARDLDRRRPHAAPGPDAEDARQGRRVPPGAPGRPEAARLGRLAGGRRELLPARTRRPAPSSRTTRRRATRSGG